MRITLLGLSITSSWGNGHAVTYRTLARALAERGHEVLFLERDLPWYAANRDLPRPPYGQTILYSSLAELRERYTGAVREADLVIVGSYTPDGIAVGEWATATARGLTAFYDIDTPLTLSALARGDCQYLSADLIPRYHLYLSFSGGSTLERIQERYGARLVRPLYCAVDPDLYYPEPPAPALDARAPFTRPHSDGSRHPTADHRQTMRGHGRLPAMPRSAGRGPHEKPRTSDRGTVTGRQAWTSVRPSGGNDCLGPADPSCPRQWTADAGLPYDLGYMGTFSADRQPALERLLIVPARRAPDRRFIVAGPQFPPEIAWPANVERIEHLSPREHRAFYNAQRFTLNVTRAEMAAAGYAPSVRLFEAAACAIPVITDPWPGLETFFAPGHEILVAQTSDEVPRLLDLPEGERLAIGQAAQARVLAEHTGAHRAAALEDYVREARGPAAAH